MYEVKPIYLYINVLFIVSGFVVSDIPTVL